jgi:hypothetical protein
MTADTDLTWRDRKPGPYSRDCAICGESFGDAPGPQCPEPARELHAIKLPAPPAVVAKALGWGDPAAAARDPRACAWPSFESLTRPEYDWHALAAAYEAA